QATPSLHRLQLQPQILQLRLSNHSLQILECSRHQPAKILRPLRPPPALSPQQTRRLPRYRTVPFLHRLQPHLPCPRHLRSASSPLPRPPRHQHTLLLPSPQPDFLCASVPASLTSALPHTTRRAGRSQTLRVTILWFPTMARNRVSAHSAAHAPNQRPR